MTPRCVRSGNLTSTSLQACKQNKCQQHGWRGLHGRQHAWLTWAVMAAAEWAAAVAVAVAEGGAVVGCRTMK